MRILIAPDKFKGSLGASEVANRIAAGLRAVLPNAELEIIPIADGGEGTAEAICRGRGGKWLTCLAHDALGRSLDARYGWLAKSRLAVLEMSAAAGLQQLAPNERNPLLTSTFGVGELLRAAASHGAREIIIGLGGSATNDGGSGMARALGFRFFGNDGAELSGTVAALLDLARIEPPNEFSLPRVTAACDVRNPLLGPSGAARVFAAQKGATPAQIEILERALSRLAEVASQTFAHDYRAIPGAGAAGGLGFGLLTFCGAQVRPGFEVVAEALDLRGRIERADIVITGEGRVDGQTLEGKAPAGMAQLARALRKPVFAIAGQATHDHAARQLFDRVVTLDDRSPDYRDTAFLLERRARELALSEDVFDAIS